MQILWDTCIIRINKWARRQYGVPSEAPQWKSKWGPDARPKCTRDTRGSVAPLAELERHQVEHTCPIAETCTRGTRDTSLVNRGALLHFSADTAQGNTDKHETVEVVPSPCLYICLNRRFNSSLLTAEFSLDH